MIIKLIGNGSILMDKIFMGLTLDNKEIRYHMVLEYFTFKMLMLIEYKVIGKMENQMEKLYLML